MREAQQAWSKQGWCRAAALGGVAALAIAAALVLAPGAQAATLLCEEVGSGAGQCEGPRGVAANFSSERLYVAESDNDRVSVFARDGEFLFAFGWGVDTGAAELETCTTASGCQKGIAGSGEGQFDGPTQIAVDNISGSEDVYVGTDSYRVQRFKADGSYLNPIGENEVGVPGKEECEIARTSDRIAVGPAGNVFVADAYRIGPKESEGFLSRVEKFSPTGECLGETVLFGPEGIVRVTDLAVDGAEDAYVTIGGELRKYDLAADEAELCASPGIGTRAIAIDAAGRLFASQREPRALIPGSIFQEITEYDTACEGEELPALQRFAYGEIGSNVAGLAAIHSGEGDLFANEVPFGGEALIRYLEIPPPGPQVAPGSLAEEVGGVRAQISAEANPEGKATMLRIDYVTEASFEESEFAEAVKGDPVPIGDGVRLAGDELEIGCDKEEVEEGEVEGCLAPATTYRYRAVATNADGEDFAEGEFTTVEHLRGLWAAGVGTDAATLALSADPLGIPTTAYFEYVTEASFEASGFEDAAKLPDPESEAPLDLGESEGEGAVSAQAAAFPLKEGTAYRYRAVVEDPLQAEVSEAKRLITQSALAPTGPCPNEAKRSGAAAYLPDCRGYEMVSPIDKEGGDVEPLAAGFGARPTVDQASTSGAKLAYGSYRAFADPESAPYTSQYIARRGAGGWQSHAINPPYEEPIGDGARLENEYRAFSEDLCEGWLSPFGEPPLAEGAIEGHFNLYRRGDELCGARSYEAITTAAPAHFEGSGYRLELQGRSADGEVAVFAANDNLEGTEAPNNPGGDIQLYAKESEGPLAFVCILPGGGASKACSAGTNHSPLAFGTTRVAWVQGAVAEDANRIFFTAANAEGPIYVRENPLGEAEAECEEAADSPCTTPVSEAGEAEAGTTKSNFWAAAADGSRAVYTTGALSSSSADLYAFELEGEETEKIAGRVSGVAGTSADARDVYFASEEAIGGAGENSEGDEASEGEPNLYYYDGAEGSHAFIGTLAGADAAAVPIAGTSSAVAYEPAGHSSRVSPSGAHLAFMSTAPLTGYDNTDAKSGEADTEVFLYEAASQELRCASCNPSGGRPAGADLGAGGTPFWVAARIPAFANSLYAARALAEDGSRLYFEAADALSPRDSNGHLDVYQWEAPGKGGCSSSAPGYSASAGGCVSLISTGKDSRDAVFVDASPSGDDVFFTTLQSLYAPDPGLVDIYDARVGGGFAPPAGPAAECEGEACQSPPAAPGFPTPSSQAFAGPGNLPPPPKSNNKGRRCAKGKHKVKRKGKVRCVKNKRTAKRVRHRRIASHRRAR